MALLGKTEIANVLSGLAAAVPLVTQSRQTALSLGDIEMLFFLVALINFKLPFPGSVLKEIEVRLILHSPAKPFRDAAVPAD